MNTLQRLLRGNSEKTSLGGSQRTIPPRETVARISPHLGSFGITRVANVTGLDRIGIPVFMVIRPNSRGLAVSQGKGLDAAAAKASGIMESVEGFHAEFAQCPIRLETYRELSRFSNVADPSSLPRSRDSQFTEHLLVPWTPAIDLFRDTEVYVPYELVHTNVTLPRMPGSGCFMLSSNGLASGNTIAEAAVHGLCELIERDALSLSLGRKDTLERRIDPGTIDDRDVLELLLTYERADMTTVLVDLTTDIGLPVIEAHIVDRTGDSVMKPIPGSRGSGCHPDRSVAAVRALTEAAQVRLTGIAGSRDDKIRPEYHYEQRAEVIERQRAFALASGLRRDWRAIPSAARPTIEGDVELLLERLRAAGIPRVMLVDLSRTELPVSVVRVIAEALEPPAESPAYRPGERAKRAAS
jgi:ribosomal protein S12 methylthiotransferase accessory factor